MEAKADLATISAQEWAQQLQARLGPRLPPLQATLELTERCNLRCVHCYINRPAADQEALQRELTLEQWKDILDQVAQAGVLWLILTGGEALLHPDFPELYLYAKRKGFLLSLFSNGTLLTPEVADLLAEYPPQEVEITLYGATAATYERITRVPGSYDRCWRGIELLRERGVVVNLKAMALTLNQHEMRAMQQTAQELGLRFRYDPILVPRLDGDPSPLDYRLSPEEIIALEREDPQRMQQWQEFCANPWPAPEPDRLFTCGAALHTFHLDPYGGLYPCLLVRWLHYDLRAGALEEAMRDFLPSVRLLPDTHYRTCWECPLRILCQQCPASAYQGREKPRPLDLHRCQLGHLRNTDLDLQPKYQHQEK